MRPFARADIPRHATLGPHFILTQARPAARCRLAQTLVIRRSDKAITREVSQDWHTHISYPSDGTVVETVILEAAKLGAWPLEVQDATAA